MTHFYLTMDAAVLYREGERPGNYSPNKRLEFSLDEIEHGRELLGHAAAKVATSPVLLRRVDQARFAHALLTLARLESEPNDSPRRDSIACQAHDDINAIRAKYNIVVKQSTYNALKASNAD
ncbi:MAG: hypothetical protein H8E66_25220 [Planctomycetes bacterium]|nr:hypothetical protein [Planctomycetota bacterium]